MIAATHTAMSVTYTPGRCLTALIVDDMEADRMRLARICRKSGIEMNVFECSDIASMRDRLDEQRFDIVFLDYNLGIDCGFEALQIVQAHPAQDTALAIMVTSIDRQETIVEAMRAGCSDYLVKEELSIDMLRKSVTSAVERRILLGAISSERGFRTAMQATARRFANSCEPEMRSLITEMLRRVWTMRQQGFIDPQLRKSLMSLEQYCGDLFSYLDEVKEMFDPEEAWWSDLGPQVGATVQAHLQKPTPN